MSACLSLAPDIFIHIQSNLLIVDWVEEGRHFAPAIAYRLESTKRRIFIGQDDDGECHLRRLAIPYIIIILHFCGLAEIIGFNRLG